MFWILTIMYFVCAPAVYNFLWKAIQPDEMFGAWQKIIDWMYRRSENLAKFIGGCQDCFANFIAWLGYITWACFGSLFIEWWWFTFLWLAIIPLVWNINVLAKHFLDVLAKKSNEQ